MPIKMIATLVLSLCLVSNSLLALGAGENAPAWTGIDLVDDAQIVFPDILKHKPAVLVFWATWCPYCKAFMPYVKEIQADYEKYGVQIISFNALERGIGDPRAYVNSLGFPLYAVSAADSIAAEYDVKFIPGLMVVDGEGLIVYRRASTDLPAGKTVSQQWAEEVRRTLDSLVGQEKLLQSE